MKVALAVNDDGFESVGLRVLVEELSLAGYRVYVCAPSTQMSGISKTVSFKRLGRDGRVAYREAVLKDAVKSWVLNATPAESVLVCLKALLPEPPSVVVSGVNMGPNLGLEDFLTSGTVGAALEAALHGVPGIAVSLAAHNVSEELHYRVAARIASTLAVEMPKLVPDVNLVNINVPPNPKGVMVTKLALNPYKPRFKITGGFIEVIDDDLEERYWDREPGTDVWAVMRGYASITPLNLNASTFVAGEAFIKLSEIIS